jgi:hypothetical protein
LGSDGKSASYLPWFWPMGVPKFLAASGTRQAAHDLNTHVFEGIAKCIFKMLPQREELLKRLSPNLWYEDWDVHA